MSATPPLIRPGWAACLVAAMLCALGAGQTAAPRTLFLLAGTCFLNDTSQTFPARLYTVGPGHTLELFRTVVPGSEGTTEILDDMRGKVYVAFPSDLGGHGRAPTKVSIIHERHPGESDVVAFNPGVMLDLHNATGTAGAQALGSYALFVLFPEPPPTVKGRPAFMQFIRGPAATLVAVAGDPPAKGPRLAKNDWGLYRRLTFYGSPGGPGAFPVGPEATVEDGSLVVRYGGRAVVVDQAPAPLAAGVGGRTVRIVAANLRFVVTWAFRANNLSAPATFYVHDRQVGRWEEIKFSSSLPESRIFGPWLATTIMTYQGTGGGPWEDPNPGHKHERDRWLEGLLPDVRLEFEDMRLGYRIPGELVLNNLADGRRMTIDTGQEDSEILDVRKDGLVLYRVNDEIFSAQIEGDKLGPPKLVVKGEDVPEVHWAFWSNAQAQSGQALPAMTAR